MQGSSANNRPGVRESTGSLHDNNLCTLTGVLNLSCLGYKFDTQVRIVHYRDSETHGAERAHVNGQMAIPCGKPVEATGSLPGQLRLRDWHVQRIHH